MEVPQSTIGVRTRAAKTLALQRLQKTQAPPQSDTSPGSYLQLRTRRLEKQPSETSKKQLQKEKESCRKNRENAEQETEGKGFSCEIQEVSFGENSLEFEARDRSTRESTPCSLIRNSDTIATPGSTTRRTSSSTTNRGGNNLRKFIPMNEIEEFFAYAEQQAQKKFIEKYNFDIVNDSPLPGRYEWEQVVQ